MEKSGYLFVVPWSLDHVGGVNQVVLNLAREMIAHEDFEPIVLIADWHASQPVWERKFGFRLVRWRIRPFSSDMSWRNRVAYRIWEYRFANEFQDFCRRNRIKVVNPHYPGETSLALGRILQGLQPSIRMILSFHGADLSAISRGGQRPDPQWERLARNLDGVVVCSANLGERARAVFGHALAPTVIHNGLDLDAFTGTRDSGLGDGPRKIINIAKFEHKKGQDVLIKAFALLAADYPDVELVLVGATDRELDNLKRASIELGVGDRVVFVCDLPHEQIAGLLSEATIFALPSREEPFGIVILEAGSLGLPVVASSVGGIPEILTDGQTGILVEPDEPLTLANRLKSLLDDPQLRAQLGGRLQAHVRSRFSWKSAYEKYLALTG